MDRLIRAKTLPPEMPRGRPTNSWGWHDFCDGVRWNPGCQTQVLGLADRAERPIRIVNATIRRLCADRRRRVLLYSPGVWSDSGPVVCRVCVYGRKV